MENSELRTLPVIIVPAYNEQKVIARTLQPLYKGISDGQYSIVVAVNGSSDDSVDFIKNKFPDVICLDIELGSKTNAINTAEKHALAGFPRIYMDADVVVSYDGVISLINTLESTSEPLLVAPKAVMEFEHSSFFVKTFYRAWFKTVFYSSQGFGAGVYALNKSARGFFETFPNVIADDGFIREVIPVSQQKVDTNCISIVTAPKTLGSLIKIKTRSKLGNIELKNKLLIKNKKIAKKRFVTKPTIFEFIIYCLVNLIASKLASYKYDSLDTYKWDKDESSRTLNEK